MAETIAQLQAKADEFVKADRHNKLNARQQASLDKLNRRIEAARAAEAAEPVRTVESFIVDVGPAPLPNNNRGQTPGQFYDCNTDPAKFFEDYGYTMEHAFNDQLTEAPASDRGHARRGVPPGHRAPLRPGRGAGRGVPDDHRRERKLPRLHRHRRDPRSRGLSDGLDMIKVAYHLRESRRSSSLAACCSSSSPGTIRPAVSRRRWFRSLRASSARPFSSFSNARRPLTARDRRSAPLQSRRRPPRQWSRPSDDRSDRRPRPDLPRVGRPVRRGADLLGVHHGRPRARTARLVRSEVLHDSDIAVLEPDPA